MGASDGYENILLFLWGQSNQEVLNVGSPVAELQGEITGSYMFTGSSFDTLEYGVNTNGTGVSNVNNHSIELRLAKTLSKPNYWGKFVKGGTSLEVDWASGTQLRTDLITSINAALALQDRRIWFFTNQWESDIPYSANYYDNLSEFLASVQSGTKSFERIIMTRASLDSNRLDPETQVIIDAQEQYASENSKVTLVNSDGLVYQGDNLHWSQGAVEVMAQRNLNVL